MPELKNNLFSALSIEGAQGHTYHIDGQQSIEITDEDVKVMREMEGVRLLESSGGIIISVDSDHSVAEPVGDVDDDSDHPVRYRDPPAEADSDPEQEAAMIKESPVKRGRADDDSPPWSDDDAPEGVSLKRKRGRPRKKTTDGP